VPPKAQTAWHSLKRAENQGWGLLGVYSGAPSHERHERIITGYFWYFRNGDNPQTIYRTKYAPNPYKSKTFYGKLFDKSLLKFNHWLKIYQLTLF